MHSTEPHDLAHGASSDRACQGLSIREKSEIYAGATAPSYMHFRAAPPVPLCKNSTRPREVEKSSKIRGYRHTAHCVKTHPRAISDVHFSTPAAHGGGGPRERGFFNNGVTSAA